MLIWDPIIEPMEESKNPGLVTDIVHSRRILQNEPIQDEPVTIKHHGQGSVTNKSLRKDAISLKSTGFFIQRL